MSRRKIPCTIGERHNSWTIISEVGYTADGKLRVVARCDCGTEKEVYYTKLKHGKSKSCGKCGIKEYSEGDKVGRWTILYKIPNDGNMRRWHCRCDCGNEKDVQATKLDHGRTLSCGCYAAENVSRRMKRHGLSRTRIHREWSHMRQRCLPNAECHKRYYDRGISVCPEWESFDVFYEYVSKLENFGKESYSLDRIDNNKGYEPGNVRWADMKTQGRNKENTIFLTYNGETKTLCEWSEITGVPYGRIYRRIRYRGYSVKDAIETPPKYRGKETSVSFFVGE